MALIGLQERIKADNSFHNGSVSNQPSSVSMGPMKLPSSDELILLKIIS